MEERVVIVDDDAVILRSANTVLVDAGYKVTCLKSGRLLLDYVVKNTIDILLLDIKMPELNGFETMKQVMAMEEEVADIPVICQPIMCRIQRHPLHAVTDLHPCMRSTLSQHHPHDISTGYFFHAKKRKHDMCIVLTYAHTKRSRFLCRRCDLSNAGNVFDTSMGSVHK